MPPYPEKPLAGQTVLVTQPRPLAESAQIDWLNAAGTDVIFHPTREIREPADWGPVDVALAHLSRYGTVAFLDQNAVQYFFGRFREKAGPEGLSRCLPLIDRQIPVIHLQHDQVACCVIHIANVL